MALKYKSMEKPEGKKADDKEPAAKKPAEAAAAEPAPKEPATTEPTKAPSAETEKPADKHGAAIKAMNRLHETERSDVFKRHRDEIRQMHDRHTTQFKTLADAEAGDIAPPAAEAAAAPAATVEANAAAGNQ